MQRDSNFNSGLLLGAIIGGVAAMLLAPSSGSRNRRRLGRSLTNAKETWQETGDVQQTMTALFGKMFADSHASLDKARAYFDKQVAQAKLNLADLKEKDLDQYIEDAHDYFENNDPEGYNDSWIEELKREWRLATQSANNRRTRKA